MRHRDNHGMNIRTHRAGQPETDGVDEGANAEIHAPFGDSAEMQPHTPEMSPYVPKSAKRKLPGPEKKRGADKYSGIRKDSDGDYDNDSMANDTDVDDDI